MSQCPIVSAPIHSLIVVYCCSMTQGVSSTVFVVTIVSVLFITIDSYFKALCVKHSILQLLLFKGPPRNPDINKCVSTPKVE